MRPRRFRFRLPSIAASLLGLTLLGATVASADTLHTDPGPDRSRYIPFDELSYEFIVEPGTGYDSTVRIRIALHNNSSHPQDFVETLGVPRNTELRGLRIARNGQWTDGVVTTSMRSAGRRNPNTVLARPIAPQSVGDLPGVELVGFQIDSGATVQVELVLSAYPGHRGDRWNLDVPRRNSSTGNLVDERRVLVKGLRKGQQFYVDGVANGKTPFVKTRAEDGITVSWPAALKTGSLLDGRVEITPNAEQSGGNMRVYLRLGQSPAKKPDHITLLVDTSKSTSRELQRQAGTMLDGLLDQLPSRTTFDLVAFSRDAEVVELPSKFPRAGNAGARKAMRTKLGGLKRSQGTDLEGALSLVGERLRDRAARRPMVIVVTDGMLPMTVPSTDVEAAMQAGLKNSRKPEILFVVDDPILATRGLDSSHTVATLSGTLGARISLETLANLGPERRGFDNLLFAPRVLGDLDVALPKRVTLFDDVPDGLVAGNFLVVEGKYEGRAPKTVRVGGQYGSRRIKTNLRVHARSGIPPALAASTESDANRDDLEEEGMVRPPWFTRKMLREGQSRITQAGRGGVPQVGQLDSSIFQRYLRTRVLPRARACYNRALARNPGQAGRVVLHMEVGKGEVMRARIKEKHLQVDDTQFDACLADAAWAMDIPAGHLDAQVYQVHYPVSFMPPTNARPAATDEGPDPVFEMLLKSADVLLDNGKK